MSELMRIPQPPPKPIVGNTFELDPKQPIQSLANLLKQYGEIVQLNMMGREVVIVGSRALVHEVCDQKRFEKKVGGALEQVRNLAGDGLFTAHGDEENWAIAHRILVPAFGPLSIRNMFDGMKDIASQLLQKWARFGDEPIDVPADFTRLTLDTIALCTFSHRYNSFYSQTDHPMVAAMGRSLLASGERLRRLPGTAWMYKAANKRYEEDIALQHKIADELVAERKASGENKGDLLDAMLNGRDPVTGKGLSPDNIRFQLVTFLIAGHETTSGMLSFLFYFLLKNPSRAAAIREEVDRVCGAEPIRFEHLAKLEYIDAALKETLRLKSTAPAFSVTPIKETEVLAGKYEVKKGNPIMVVLDALHRDPAVWGDDAEAFRPERMLNGGFANLPADAWKPFGNGMRACIGRPFAWQESLLVVAAIFQNFDVRPDNTNYELAIKSTLTIKPTGFFMRARLRKDRNLSQSLGMPVQNGEQNATAGTASTTATAATANQDGPKLTILYGSNAGTCKALAEKLADTASSLGRATSVKHLNEQASGHLPTEGQVAIITASYEGQPTDDANFFYQWLKTAPEGSAKGVRYSVFGCGHPDWASTYHAVPRFIDEQLHKLGGERLLARGEGNASSADLFDHFDDWEAKLMEALGSHPAAKNESEALSVQINKQERQRILQYDSLSEGKVISNTVITKGETDVKRHIVFEVPEGAEYRAGDYLEFLPVSPAAFVRRALARFDLHPDDMLRLSAGTRKLSLPLDLPVSAADLFAGFVELGQPVSLRQVQRLVAYAKNDTNTETLEELSKPEVYQAELADKRVGLLDLLERLPDLDMPLSDFLLALPPLRIRQYSISSSPLDNPRHASLTVSILQAPHISGSGTMYHGAATTYLSNLSPGSRVHIGVRPSSGNFHLPLDPKIPIILGAAGSGIAPFRAFIQERALQKSAGREVGPAVLFFGCHSPDQDALYDDEMAKWEADGVVSVRYAFSRTPAESKGCKHIQNRIYLDREEVAPLFSKQGAKLYFCGSKKVANSVEDVLKKLYTEHCKPGSLSADEWFAGLRAERFATDVFG